MKNYLCNISILIKRYVRTLLVEIGVRIPFVTLLIKKDYETLINTNIALDQERKEMFKEIEILKETLEITTVSYNKNSINNTDQTFSILFNTMPKSGSIFISRKLASNLDLYFSTTPLAYGYFPQYFLISEAFRNFCPGGVIRQEHFDASSINLEILSHFEQKLILHVRDPRQATLSWVHHYNRLLIDQTQNKDLAYDLNKTIFWKAPAVDYLDWSLERQIDWHLQTHLRSLVTWLRGWVETYENKNVEILFTTYEDFVNDPKSFFERILDFYQIEKNGGFLISPEKTIANNYRVGEIDEFKKVFSEEQMVQAGSIIGSDILKRFGWE